MDHRECNSASQKVYKRTCCPEFFLAALARVVEVVEGENNAGGQAAGRIELPKEQRHCRCLPLVDVDDVRLLPGDDHVL